jgi:bifunctional enzyme CysN/CysC
VLFQGLELPTTRRSDGQFCEVYIDTPFNTVEARDRKGLYAKARRGELEHFTGVDSPDEPPESPEIHIETRTDARNAAELVIEQLHRMGIVG